MEKAVIKKLNENTWQFTEQLLGENVYCYLLAGTRKALLIDTAYGFTDIAGAVKELTKLPVTVVNTHGHFDHICGNRFFSEVMISDLDQEVYQRHSDFEELKKLLLATLGGSEEAKAMLQPFLPVIREITSLEHVRVLPLPENGCFDLGDRMVEIIETPGHTTGSISLLDRKNGWLFSGDTCGDEGMLLHFPEASDVKVFHQTIRRIMSLVAQGFVTRNYPCHQTSPAPLSKLKYYDRILARMENGGLTEEELNSGSAQEGGIRIVFSPQRVKEELA